MGAAVRELLVPVVPLRLVPVVPVAVGTDFVARLGVRVVRPPPATPTAVPAAPGVLPLVAVPVLLCLVAFLTGQNAPFSQRLERLESRPLLCSIIKLCRQLVVVCGLRCRRFACRRVAVWRTPPGPPPSSVCVQIQGRKAS